MGQHKQQPTTLPETATPLESGAEPFHVLAVGASGMLADAVRTLAFWGWRVSVVARNRDRLETLAAEHRNIYPLVCDYTDEAGYEAALTVAFAERGSPTLAIVWMHSTAPEGPQHTAQVISRSLAAGESGNTERPWEEAYRGSRPGVVAHRRNTVCRFFHLHGSSSGAPDAEVEHYRRTCSLLSRIAYRAVVLGREQRTGGWLSDYTISSGVLEAIKADRTVYWIGGR